MPSGLTLWDRLQSTLKLNLTQAEVEIGTPEHCRQEEVTLPRLVAMPFGHQSQVPFPGARRGLRGPASTLAP